MLWTMMHALARIAITLYIWIITCITITAINLIQPIRLLRKSIKNLYKVQ